MYLQKLSSQQIADAWFEAFNEHDIDKLLTLYSDDAEHYSPKLKVRKPETRGLIKGKSALYAWWKDAFDRLPSLVYIPNYTILDEKHIFMEYTRKVQIEEDLIVGEVLFLDKGKIIASKVFHS